MYNGKNVKKAMKCECDAKMRKNSHRIAKKTGKLINQSLFCNRIRIALPALLLLQGLKE
jgi:hypothetical protein